MKTRPAATVGCPYADNVSGNPNAHLSFRPGTCAAVSPACSPGWKRVLVTVGLHPFQRGPVDGSPSGAVSICGAQRDGSLGGACANDRAGTSKSTTTEDTEDTEAKSLPQNLCVLCVLCGGEYRVI